MTTQTYTIRIDDDQRKMLLDAMLNCHPAFVPAHIESSDAHQDAREMIEMLRELPEVNEPGLVHGFCL